MDGEGQTSETSTPPSSPTYKETLDSWKKIQTNTFIRWTNEKLKEVGGEPLVDLERDFSDGLRLITLVEVLSGKKFPRRYNRQPTRRNQKLENVTLALEYLQREEGIRIVNIDSSDIVDHKIKLILGLMWSLILHYSIAVPSWEGETSLPEEKKPDQTPKQRLLSWLQNKVPDQHITNFTSDWHDGRNIGALVDSIAPGLCPDWRDWPPEDAAENARKAMTIAEEWLNVPQLITPDELTDPKLDELSAMTYLAQFPNARLKSPVSVSRTGACSKGPGVVGLPLECAVDSLSGEFINATVTVTDPNGVEKQCDVIRTRNSKTLHVCFNPDMEGKHKVTFNFEEMGEEYPEQVLTLDVEGSVSVAGPGLQPQGVASNWKTSFDIIAEKLVIRDVEVTIVQPDDVNGGVLSSDIRKVSNDLWEVEYTPLVEGPHSISVLVNGAVVRGSPFNVLVTSEDVRQISLRGRGLQPSGVRVGDNAPIVLQLNQTSDELGDSSDAPWNNTIKSLDPSFVEIFFTDPSGSVFRPDIVELRDNQLTYNFSPEEVGKYVGKVTYKGQNIDGSPFTVNVSPAVTRKSHVYGPGLSYGVVGSSACFTVDRHEDEDLTGIFVDGPQPVEVKTEENDDGSKDVSYVPVTSGEYAVHILCNNEDIPESPYMVDVVPEIDGFFPSKVLARGDGLKDTGVVVDEWAEFIIDTTLAGKEAELRVEVFDDEYKEVEVQLENLNKIGIVECQYKPMKTGQHRIFISYGGVNISKGPFRVLVQDSPESYPVVELPVEVVQAHQVSSQNDEDINDLQDQALRIKAYGEGLFSGFAGHICSFVVVMSDFNAECLGVAVDGPCKVEMDCLETKEGYKFTYIPRSGGEFMISVNYAGKYSIAGSPFHVFIKEVTNLYRVCVYTGDKLFAGTDANVFITLFGEIGDTGTIQLKHSRTHLNKFERNQMDEFFIEAVNIGELKKIKIGHDNAGAVGSSWYLDRVEIESSTFGKRWVFPFCRWLSKGDLAVEMVAINNNDMRVIQAQNSITFSGNQEMKIEEVTQTQVATVSCENVSQTAQEELQPTTVQDGFDSYHITVVTGNKLFAGTDANVFIELTGEKASTEILELKSSKNKKSKFERNQKDEFVFDIKDVGELKMIRIGHDNSGLFGSSWFLERVEVESTLLRKKWLFPFHQWLSKEKSGCNLDAEIFAQHSSNVEAPNEKDLEASEDSDTDVKVSGAGLEKILSVNVPTSFLVDVSEAEPGNLLLLSIQGPTDPCAVNMTYEGSGIYNVSYRPQEKGTHLISIKWGRRSVVGSPFVVCVM